MKAASFFTHRPGEERWGCDYVDQLRLLEASCRRFGVDHVVLTDMETELPDGFAAFRRELPRELMRAVLYVQQQYLASTEHNDEDIILLGADCVLARDPREVFEDCFDVAVTVDHSLGDCPLNTGAIFVAATATPLAAQAWDEAMHGMGVSWGDDQRALYSRLGPLPNLPALQQSGGLAVKVMKLHPWNHAPKDVNEATGTTGLLHFRGPRKKFMRSYCKRHLSLEPV